MRRSLQAAHRWRSATPMTASHFISLPFTFSIFSDIYAAGERLSISANGWISLEGASDRAYQNASLPAATVPQTTGGTGTVPASLIAPYWDDLILKAGTSNVSMRVAGTAPNRQLIVEWSNLSILDDSGNDQNASVTFEAVLYEGSNDIQFLYGDLSGPLSNGSSATVGMQNLNRTSAVLTSFNQPTVKNKSVLTYRYQNGNYITTSGTVDLTPPSKPVVTDEGALTSNRAQLAASWIEDIPASGIGSFQYAIGTTPGGTDVRPYTTTAQNSVVVTGLNLQTNTTYYFAVKAISGAGVTSQTGVSDGIRYDPAFQPQTRIIPSAPQSAGEFSGIALLAPASSAGPATMNVVLRAFDSNGAYIVGPGIHNPTSISLSAGQQYAKLVSELFGVASFDGWIQIEASDPRVGYFHGNRRDRSVGDGWQCGAGRLRRLRAVSCRRFGNSGESVAADRDVVDDESRHRRQPAAHDSGGKPACRTAVRRRRACNRRKRWLRSSGCLRQGSCRSMRRSRSLPRKHRWSSRMRLSAMCIRRR